MPEEYHQVFEELTAARAAYRAAMDKFDEQVRLSIELGPGHPDGTQALRSAKAGFAEATDRYHAALDAYLEHVRKK